MQERTNDTRACEEYSRWSRRSFLGRAAATTAAVTTAPMWLPRVVMARPGSPAGRDVLVHVFLRGAMDGLTTVAPYGDGDLYVARPTLAIQPPGATDGAVDLDGFFGLAPAAAPLLTPFSNGHLAFVHASGSPDPTRSHFDAFQYMELGIPEQPLGSVTSGWLARHLQTSSPVGSGFLRAVAVSDILPRTLAMGPGTLPIPDLDDFGFPGDPQTAAVRSRRLQQMYLNEAPPVGPAALGTLDTIGLLDSIDFAGYVPAGGAVYPGAEIGLGLQQTAALIKADLGVETVMLELGGWDLHNQLGPINGVMANLLDTLTRSLEAFYLDMLPLIDNVVVVVMSEFGRRVAENQSAGVDHGHGNVMTLMGGHIAGGQVHGTWPGLAPANLDKGDVAITTDYRDVLSEILEKRLGNTQLDVVFPNHTPNFPGVVV